MQTKNLKTDIVIAGAGPAGMTLALILARAGLDVIVADPAKPPLPAAKTPASGRTAALLNGSLNVLHAAGAWPMTDDLATPLKIMRIVDDSRSSLEAASVSFDAKDIGQPAFGWNISNAVLRAALFDKAQAVPTIRLLNETAIESYSIEGQTVQAATSNGGHITASLIAGTDGRNSIVRKIAGIDAKIHDYHQTGITCLIDHSKPHDFTSTEFHRDGGPFTIVPMPGLSSSVVWVEKSDDAKRFLSMKKNELEQAIQDRSKGIVGTISLKSNPESWPLMLLHADKITAPRAVIAAEAAHVMSPIGAQGLNLSLRDIASLAETIIDAARLGEDIGSANVLSRYERRRSLDLHTRVGGIDTLNRAVANDISFVKDLRRFGLKGLEKIPALRHLAMHQGLAPAMDEGRILAGRAV